MDHKSQSRAARVAARKTIQDKNLFGRLSAAAIASRGHAKRFLQLGGGLSITEWRILWDLQQAGPLSVQDMASIQRTDHSLISRALPVMRKKGFVKTAPNAEDKRQSLVELTPGGARAFEIAAPIMKTRRDSLSETFAPHEIATFLKLLDRFEEHLDQPIEHVNAVDETD